MIGININEVKKYMLDHFTHERLNHKFHNNFDLTNYAINIAKRSIIEGVPITLGEVLKDLEALPDIEEAEEGEAFHG
jgi:hypothetical protein